MNELHVMLMAVLLRGVAACMCVAGAVYLADRGLEGWGWLIFLALCLGCVTVSHKKDE